MQYIYDIINCFTDTSAFLINALNTGLRSKSRNPSNIHTWIPSWKTLCIGEFKQAMLQYGQNGSWPVMIPEELLRIWPANQHLQRPSLLKNTQAGSPKGQGL